METGEYTGSFYEMEILKLGLQNRQAQKIRDSAYSWEKS